MMDMTFTTGPGSPLLWVIHIGSVIAFFMGIAFFIVVAVRTFTIAQLKTWAVALVVAGTVACLLTIAVRGAPWSGGMTCGGDMMKNPMMMQGGKKGMDHGQAGMMEMSMDDMSTMLEGKTGDEFDAAFIQGMIPHHQGAIDMANAALASARHDEIKKMAQDIISSQQREIDQMKQWQTNWGY